MDRIKWISIVLTAYFCFCLSFPAATKANIQEACGLSAKAISMGNAFSAIADDFSASYYNPAGLGQHDNHSLEINYIFCQPQLKQYLSANPNAVNAQEDIHFRSAIIGTTFDLSRAINTHGRNLVLGIALTVGDNLKVAWRIHDWNPQVPRFIHYGDYMNRVHVFSGTGMEIIKDKLYVGGAINLTQDMGAEVTVTVDPLEEGALSKEIDIDGDSEISPIAGILAKPFSWLSIAYTYRDGWVQKTPVTMNTILAAFGSPLSPLLSPLSVKLPVTDYYLPWNMTIGMAVTLSDSLVCSFDVTHYHWSDFKLPMWEGKIKTWRDTLLPRFGIEYKVNEELVLRGGYYFEGSPVPDQSDTLSNHLDFNKHVLSAGLGYTVIKVPFIGELPLNYPLVFNTFVQYQILNDRVQQKNSATNQSHWIIEGYQYAFGIGLSLSF